MQEITYREAIRDAIREEMLRDKTVFVMGTDVGCYGSVFGTTKGLWEEFGDERIRDTPISENGFIGAAVGAAVAGMRPIVEVMFVDFAVGAMDQIVNQAAKLRYMSGGKIRVPLVIRTTIGAGRSQGAQHSQSLHAWFVHIPGLKVAMPSTPADAKGLLKTAVRDDSPVMIFEHKFLYGTKGIVTESDTVVPCGRAEVKREGK